MAAKRVVRKRVAKRGALSPLGRGDLATSLILIFPLFLAYQVGVVFSTSMNGVDFVTRNVYAAVGRDRQNYLIAHLVLGTGFVVYMLYLLRKRSFSFAVVPPLLLESTIYALTLGSFIVFVMQQVLGFSIMMTINLDTVALGKTGEAVVISLGAGVYEELMFRLGLMAGGAILLKRTGMEHFWAVGIALVVSALLFSGAHHVGALGDKFTWGVFTYRALAGVIFGLIFYYRSLAHAVYSHFLYDFYVLVIH